MASLTSGCEWPRQNTAGPPEPSRYSLPDTSTTRLPRPLASFGRSPPTTSPGLTLDFAAVIAGDQRSRKVATWGESGIIDAMTVIKINALTVPAEMGEEVAKRFAARAGAVDGHDGFEGFELLRPTDERTTWLVVTRWRDVESFEAWRTSPSFAHGHRAEPSAGQRRWWCWRSPAGATADAHPGRAVVIRRRDLVNALTVQSPVVPSIASRSRSAWPQWRAYSSMR